jgi:hypothetical protein
MNDPVPSLTHPLKGRELVTNSSCGRLPHWLSLIDNHHTCSSPFKGDVGRGMGSGCSE